MRALTIWQPWATLIVIGAKPYEFRRWPAPKALVGQRLVIHAGARPVEPAEVTLLLYKLRRGEDGTGLVAKPAIELLARLDSAEIALPLASGLGTAVLGKPQKASALFGDQVADSDRIDEHMWAWPLSDAQPFEPIVPARGSQGLWMWGG